MSEEPPPLVPPQENITGTMNNIIEDNTAKIILQMIEKLSDKIERLTPQPTQKKINPKTGRPNQCYCHSCGCCDHWEKFCPNKKPGHIDSANFKDRKGGSNKGCLPNNELRWKNYKNSMFAIGFSQIFSCVVIFTGHQYITKSD